QPPQRLTWPERETKDLKSSLEESQGPARAEQLVQDAFDILFALLAQQRSWIPPTQGLVPLSPFGLYNATLGLDGQDGSDFLVPGLPARQHQTADARNDLSLQTNALVTHNVSYLSRIQKDCAPDLPFGGNTDDINDIEWTDSGNPPDLY
ncbi:hypothetical protein MMC26_000773, partial [Xylographa opegraphella]|nr:hypothetical protein [Xylographa opegraphella]